MPTYEELQAIRAKKLADDKTAREKRDVDELQKLIDGGFLDDPRAVLVHFPDAPADLPGHYVGKTPSTGVAQNFRHTMWSDSTKAGVVEAKSKAGAGMARMSKTYPEDERYNALIIACPFVPDRIAESLIKAAEAGAADEAKK
jgi:hypothetical protein